MYKASGLTRALERVYYAPTWFSQISHKTAACSAAIFEVLTYAQIKNTPCVQILTSQVKRSGHQVRSKSDVHSDPGFKLEGRAVGTALVQMFANFQDEVLEWVYTYRMHISDLYDQLWPYLTCDPKLDGGQNLIFFCKIG